MLRRLMLLPLLTAVLLGAYARRDGKAPAPPSPVPEDAVEVELLSPGTAPLAPLRYRHHDVARTFHLVVQSGIYVMRGVLQGQDSYLPAIAATWDDVGQPESVPDACVRWRLSSAEVAQDKKVPATVVDATKKVVAGLVGREATTCVGDRGGLRLTMPEPGDAAERQVLDIFAQAFDLEFTVPLPREPVGVGAKWRVRRPLPLALADATYQLDYELMNVADRGFETAMAMTFSAEPQRVKPKDPTVTLPTPVVVDRIEGQGRGELFCMLDEMTPMQADLSFEAVMTLTPSAHEGAPTEDERTHAYRLAYRTRQMMKAAQLGPLAWEDDPGTGASSE
jgi:hypothetical protein